MRYSSMHPPLISKPHHLQRLVGDDVTTLGREDIGRRLLGGSADRLSLVRSKGLVAVEVLVDDTGHAFLAMVADRLGAVVPEGLLVLDGKGEDVGGLSDVGLEVEAGEDTRAARKGLAGLVEGGLHHGVVLGQEVELDQVSDLGDNVLRFEVETIVGSGGTSKDAVDDTGGWGGGWGSGGKAQKGGGSDSEGGEGDHFD